MPEIDDEPRVCAWCTRELDDDEGFEYEAFPDADSDAPDGSYCSSECWLAAF